VAPDFRLTNQFGQQISLSAFRGKVVILAFTDSQCTTGCPLTTQAMLAAKQLLGRGRTGEVVRHSEGPALLTHETALARRAQHVAIMSNTRLLSHLPFRPADERRTISTNG